jgi:hypothetical protein
MSKHLERDLEELHGDILTLAGAVEEAIFGAIRSLQERGRQPRTPGYSGR